MHRIIRVYSLLAVLLDPIVHVFLENTVYGVYTVHRIIRVYSMLSKEKGPYGATMLLTFSKHGFDIGGQMVCAVLR